MITCPHCKSQFKGNTINARHKRVCDGWSTSPPPTPCLCGHQSTSGTQMKRHRRTCEIWQSRDKQAVRQERIRQNSLHRYGVEDPTRTPEANAKRKRTNIERYGAENPFCRESSVFEKVMESLDGKRPVLRGEENPFAWESTKGKIRETMVEKYGAENPQQVPEIREKTLQTCLERYGGIWLGSEEIQAKTRATNLERYGDEFPQRTPEIQEQIANTNMERYGGTGFASPELLAKYKEVCLEKYGYEWPQQHPDIKEKIMNYWMEKCGLPVPPGFAEYMGGGPGGKNNLEQRFDTMTPDNVYYTGDARYWVRHKGASKARNPDFIVLSQKQFKLLEAGAEPNDLRVSKVIEVFGDYWHGPEITGKKREDHQREVEDYYSRCGLDCLVLWEWEINNHIEETRNRVGGFLQ